MVARPQHPAAARSGPLVPLLDLHAAAALLGVSPETLRKWAARGRVASVKLGARLLFSQTALEEWVAARTRHARKPVPE